MSADRTNPKWTGFSMTGGRLNLHQAIIEAQSQQQTFTITSTGEVDLVIEQIKIAGIYANEFHIVQDQCSFEQLAPGESCTVTVSFEPTSTGSKTALLTIISNGQEKTVEIRGTVEKSPAGSHASTPELELAEHAIYNQDMGEITIPTVAVRKASGEFDIWQVKLCHVQPDFFKLCASEKKVAELRKLGDTTFDPSTNIANIPVMSNGENLYEVDLQHHGNFVFEIVESIPILR